MALSHDLRGGVRLLLKQPVVTSTAIVALSLGIALATAGFTAARAILWSTLPYPAADRIVRLYSYEAPGGDRVGLDVARLRLLRARTETFSHVGAAGNRIVNVVLPSGRLDAVKAVAMTPATLTYTPFQPIAGRSLIDDDGRAGTPPVVMIGEAIWRREFNGDPGVAGRTVDVGGAIATIVGVAPATMQFPNSPDLWLPLSNDTLGAGSSGRADGAMRVIGVLREGVTVERANVEAAGVSAQIAAATPGAPEVRIDVRHYTDYGIDAPVMLFTGALSMILFVIATNIANLVFARSLARSREFAVRAALGASRVRIVGQVFLEVVVLGAVAAPLGLAGAGAIARQMQSWIEDAPFWMSFTPGADAVAFVIVITLVACGIAGALPALRATRRDTADDLRSSGTRTGDARFGRIASALVVAQIALSIVALFSALVFADSFRSFGAANLGLPDQEVLAATLSLDNGTAARVRDIERALRAIPGVQSSGITTSLPRQSPPLARIEIDSSSASLRSPADWPDVATAPRDRAPLVEVTAGALEAFGAKAIAGRLLQSADFATGAPRVAVVNEPFARKFFGAASPLGRRFRSADNSDEVATAPWREIVGVVPDLGLSPGDETMAGGFYVPMSDASFAYAVIRVSGQPLGHSEGLRRALGSLRPAIVPNRLLTLADAASDERAMFASVGTALLALGGVTLMLALAGVYAMMSLMVTRRTREIGIRVALGAPTASVIRTIVGRTAVQLALGAVAGGLLARAMLELRGIFVFRLSDGGTFALPGVLIAFVVAGIAASWMPLRRALGVRPVEALRAE